MKRKITIVELTDTDLEKFNSVTKDNIIKETINNTFKHGFTNLTREFLTKAKDHLSQELVDALDMHYKTTFDCYMEVVYVVYKPILDGVSTEGLVNVLTLCNNLKNLISNDVMTYKGVEINRRDAVIACHCAVWQPEVLLDTLNTMLDNINKLNTEIRKQHTMHSPFIASDDLKAIISFVKTN